MLDSFKKISSFLKTQYRYSRYFYWLACATKKGNIPNIPNIKDTSNLSILFLLPEAGINSYIKAHSVIAKQFTLKGYKVYFARCFNIFERCTFMDSEGLSTHATIEEKKMLCTYCFRSFDKNIVKNGFEYVDLRHFVRENDKDEIKKIIENNVNNKFD